jgi:hypothetical protein
MSNGSGYGVPAITGPHERLSHGQEYNPYKTIGNDPLQTFNTVHEGRSHGYEYNPYHSAGNNPPATFSVAHGGPSHGYEYSTYHTVENDPHQHLIWRVKGQVMAMTTNRIIQLPTSFPPHLVLPLNSQATTMTTICTVVLRMFLLRLSAYMRPLEIGRRKSSSDNSRKRSSDNSRKQPNTVKSITCESLKKITASSICSGTRFISSTLVCGESYRVSPERGAGSRERGFQ